MDSSRYNMLGPGASDIEMVSLIEAEMFELSEGLAGGSLGEQSLDTAYLFL